MNCRQLLMFCFKSNTNDTSRQKSQLEENADKRKVCLLLLCLVQQIIYIQVCIYREENQKNSSVAFCFVIEHYELYIIQRNFGTLCIASVYDLETFVLGYTFTKTAVNLQSHRQIDIVIVARYQMPWCVRPLPNKIFKD